MRGTIPALPRLVGDGGASAHTRMHVAADSWHQAIYYYEMAGQLSWLPCPTLPQPQPPCTPASFATPPPTTRASPGLR